MQQTKFALFVPVKFDPYICTLCKSVVDQLYCVQYKSIFCAPDKVRRDMGDQARPLNQVWGVEPNVSSGYELAEPTHHLHLIAGMQDCIPT